MDLGTVIVLVLMAGAGSFIVWLEVNSRRNRRRNADTSSAGSSSDAPPQSRS